jgi:hypothetical protein
MAMATDVSLRSVQIFLATKRRKKLKQGSADFELFVPFCG